MKVTVQNAWYPGDTGLSPMTGHGVPERASAYTGAAGSWMCHRKREVFGFMMNTSELECLIKLYHTISINTLLIYYFIFIIC